MDKAELRRAVIARRDALDLDLRAAKSADICARLVELLGRLGIRGLGWRIGRCFFGGFFLAVFRQLGLGQRIGRDRAGYHRRFQNIFFWNMRRWWAIAKSFATVLINPLPLGNGSGGRKSCKKGYQGEISTRFHSAPV